MRPSQTWLKIQSYDLVLPAQAQYPPPSKAGIRYL